MLGTALHCVGLIKQRLARFTRWMQ